MPSNASTKFNSIDVLRNTRTGTVYVLGNSWSLNLIQPEVLCDELPTLGINRALRWSPQLEMVIISDKDVLREECPRILAAGARLLLYDGLAGLWTSRAGRRGDDAYLWRLPPPMHRPAPPSRRRQVQRTLFLRTNNTGTYALEAAALLGFKEIRMLGIDFSFDNPQTHFWGRQTKHKGGATPRRRAKLIAKEVRGFKQVYDRLTHQGIRIVNESPADGPLDAFIPKERSKWLRT